MRAPWLLALCAAMPAVSAAAPEPQVDRVVLVAVVVSRDPSVTRARVLSEATARSRGRMGLDLIAEDELYASGSDAAARLRGCAGEPGCLAGLVRPAGAGQALLVVVNADVSPPLIALRLIDARSAKVVATDTVSPSGRRALADEVADRVGRFLDGRGYLRPALLWVEVEPRTARVLVNERPHEPGAALAPGKVEVRAELEGHHPERAALELSPGEERHLAMHLSPEESSLSPWIWVGAAAAVVAAAVGVGLAVAHRSDVCVCLGRECPDC